MALTLAQMTGRCSICDGLPAFEHVESRFAFHRGKRKCDGRRDLWYDTEVKQMRETRAVRDPKFKVLVQQHRSAGWL